MSGKTFCGEKYTFTLPDNSEPLGSGGNGCVYNVEICSPSIAGEYVVKFFSCAEKDPERISKRYKRFQREVEYVLQFSNIQGIIPVLDKHCPENWEGDYSAWYLMPKASPYRISNKYFPVKVLSDLCFVASTLKELHNLGYAHRDIKPNNLMRYEGRLCLIDFGLLWSNELERLTAHGEKVGPTKIMPPELECYDSKVYVDYKASDVYLFAKVLWIYLTGKTSGFKGPYMRSREMIYLQKANNIPTYEPLHLLLEQATADDWTKRIDINKCLELLNLQLGIINHSSSMDPTWKSIIRQNIYAEEIKRLVATNEPNVKAYSDAEIIAELLGAVIEHAEIRIRSIWKEKQYSVSFASYERIGERQYVLYEEHGRTVIQWHIAILNANYKTMEEEIELILSDIPSDELDMTEVRYTEAIAHLEMIYEKIYLTAGEMIVLKKHD